MKTDATEGPTTADRILAAAEDLLAQEGYEALSMRAIGSRVGLSQAAIYRHYPDKATLVASIVARGYGAILADAKRISEKGGAEDKLLAEAMRSYIERSAKRPDLFKAVLLRPIGTAQASTEVLGKGVSSTRESMALLSGLLERGMEHGVFAPADPELSAQAVWAAMYGLAARIILEGMAPGKRRSALIGREIEIVVCGLKGAL